MALFTKLPSWASILITVIAAVIVVGLVSWGTYTLVKPGPEKLPEGEEAVEEGEELPEEEDETADWKTYRNEEYGFEVKYPGDWNRIIVSDNWIVFDRPGKEYPGPDAPTYDINIKISKATIPGLDQWAIQEAGDLSVITDSKDITVDEIPGRRIEYFGFYPWYLTVGVIKEGNLYRLSTVNKDVVSTFNQILSTFKFIDETAGWKTYRNTTYGFEVKYPADWFIEDWTNEVGASNIALLIYLDSVKHETWLGGDTKAYIQVSNNSYEKELNLARGYGGGILKSRNETQITISGYNAIRMEGYVGGPGGYDTEKTIRVYIEGPIKPVILASKETHGNTFNQILSTFRFLE